MKLHDCLVLKFGKLDNSVFENLTLIIKLLARTKKCTFKEIEYEENKELFHTHSWVDYKNEITVTYFKNLTIPAISIEIESNNADLFDFFRDFLSEKLDIYHIDSLLALTQELVEKNPFLLRIVSLGTYFLKPYPFNINFLISENLNSKNVEILKSAIIAAGLSGKETFKYELLELQKENSDNEIDKLINEALNVIQYFEKHKPEFYTLD